MQYFAVYILVGESLLSFYKYLFPSSFFGPSILDIILGVVFLTLAYSVYKKPQNSALQWTSIILSLLLGPGGLFGFGGLSAILLAVSFNSASKKSKVTKS